jgi:hypothetical protein
MLAHEGGNGIALALGLGLGGLLADHFGANVPRDGADVGWGPGLLPLWERSHSRRRVHRRDLPLGNGLPHLGRSAGLEHTLRGADFGDGVTDLCRRSLGHLALEVPRLRGEERGRADRGLARVHRGDDLGRAVRDDSAGALELIRAGEASALGSLVGPDRFSSAIAELLGETVAALAEGAERLDKRDPLRGREVFADLVLGVLPRDDAREVDDPGQDACPTKHLGRLDPPLAEHQPVVAGDADRLQQAEVAHAPNERLEVAHLPAMARADHDLGNGNLKQHDGRPLPGPEQLP